MRKAATLKAVGALLLITLIIWAFGPALPEDVQRKADLPYGRVGDQTLLLDLYLPASPIEKALPCIIVIHGGAWRGGRKEDLQFLAVRLAQRGYAAACLSYRLAPKWTYPAQVDDVQRAVRWLRKNAGKWNIDPKRFGAVGASAGGHLATMLGTRETRLDEPPELRGISSKVQCVVNIVGPTDLTADYYVRASEGPLGQILLDFLGAPFEKCPEVWRDASPYYHVSSDDAPTFMIFGSEDPLVPPDQAIRMENYLKKCSVETKLVIIDGMGHGPTSEEQRKAFDKALDEALSFFDRHLKQER
ncbi:MAG: alpha/beta hydrolase [Armatimonadetes bacterium]|nr:alpha/beta hydrolase [Armatimonadota bacterium]MDW8121530.1 alpha/beta hydrolase [Armatimonadota bacterium]